MTDIQFLGVGDNGSLTRKELAHIQSLIPDSALPFLEIYGSSGQ